MLRPASNGYADCSGLSGLATLHPCRERGRDVTAIDKVYREKEAGIQLAVIFHEHGHPTWQDRHSLSTNFSPAKLKEMTATTQAKRP